MNNPIEVVVVRDVALALPGPNVSPAPPSPSLSGDQQRDVEPILDALQCQVRRRILLALADAGEANVGSLVRRLNGSQGGREGASRRRRSAITSRS